MSHDVGGAAAGPVPTHARHAFAPWELRVDALMWILTDAARPGGPEMTVDQLRAGIEALAPEEQRNLGYYAKWLFSMIATLERRGVVDRTAIEARAADIARERAREHSHG